MNYKGYEAVVEYDDEDKLFVGRVINTLDVIVFDGLSVDELEASFHAAVDDYLNDCDRLGKDPDKPFSGRFNLRIPPDLHRQVVICAEKQGVSLNAFVEMTLEREISPITNRATTLGQKTRNAQLTQARQAATGKRSPKVGKAKPSPKAVAPVVSKTSRKHSVG